MISDRIEEAKEQVSGLIGRFSGIRELHSIRLQLEYLGDYVEGRNQGERLHEINIGLMAVREVEPRDEKVAEILYEISDWVRQQMGKSGWPK